MLNETELKILSAFFPEVTERTTKEIETRSGYSHERAYSTLKTLEGKGILLKKNVGKALVYSVKKPCDSIYLSFTYYSLNKKNAFVEKYPFVWKAIEEFISKTKLEMVVLFGSYSKGEAKEESDVDLLCVYETLSSFKDEIRVAIENAGIKVEEINIGKTTPSGGRTRSIISVTTKQLINREDAKFNSIEKNLDALGIFLWAPIPRNLNLDKTGFDLIATLKIENIALSLRHKYNLKVSPIIVDKEDFRNIKSDNPELWEEIVKFGITLKGQELFYELIYRRDK